MSKPTTVQIVDSEGTPVDLAHLDPADVIRIAAAHQGVKLNCGSCRRGMAPFCYINNLRPYYEGVDTDGCPGWEPKNGA